MKLRIWDGNNRMPGTLDVILHERSFPRGSEGISGGVLAVLNGQSYPMV